MWLELASNGTLSDVACLANGGAMVVGQRPGSLGVPAGFVAVLGAGPKLVAAHTTSSRSWRSVTVMPPDGQFAQVAGHGWNEKGNKQHGFRMGGLGPDGFTVWESQVGSGPAPSLVNDVVDIVELPFKTWGVLVESTIGPSYASVLYRVDDFGHFGCGPCFAVAGQTCDDGNACTIADCGDLGQCKQIAHLAGLGCGSGKSCIAGGVCK